MNHQKNIGDKFYHFNHIPIAIRSYGLIAKKESFLQLYSKVTGNLLLEEIPKIEGEITENE
jgi:hypothetical protein